MSGPRILFAVIVALVLLLWAALREDPRVGHTRGLDESALALAAMEAELAALDVPYQALARRGLMLELKGEHDQLRSGLALLRARRLKISEDRRLERHAVLPAYREIVTQADELLAMARSLHQRVLARQEFILESSPLLGQARALRDALLAQSVEDPVLANQVNSAVGWFAELEGFARNADAMLQRNLEQGRTLAGATLSGLRSYLEQVGPLVEQVRSP